MPNRLKVGLIINPVAGLGGRVGLKGSDGLEIQQQALSLGAKPEAQSRTRQTLDVLAASANSIRFYTVSGLMGGDLLDSMGFEHQICYTPTDPSHTTADDTSNAASIMEKQAVDILLFAGGDGTARNILSTVAPTQLCLGIPAGVKIYSGVFTVTPENAGELIDQLIDGKLVEMKSSQVLDINEDSYRQGKINTRVYGEMLVPSSGEFVQAVKVSGKESEPLVHQEIAAWVCENMEPDTLYLIGSGSSCKVIKDELGIDGTLLGVDVVLAGECLLKDGSEQQLLAIMDQYKRNPVKLVITMIGGQGILLGRGNHQICHKVIRRLGLENLLVVSSKTKITELEGKPLGVDTGDKELNNSLSGFISIITGYDDTILYPLGPRY
ncbi:MAG: ATP-NAD kinase [Gammaproteobacteria bacterium]|nr:MAG: ATP-NAD kinase [Gammaproteobacteria bacterium]